MDVHVFSKLSPASKLHTTLLQGVCIAERNTRLTQVFLYQIEGFYVEVHHDRFSDEVLFLSSFNSMDQLAPYLSKMNLEAISSF